MEKSILIVLTLILFVACSQGNEAGNRDTWLEEIRNTETEFAQLAEEAGIRTAFLAYAADDAVLLRGSDLIRGKEGIGSYYKPGLRDTTTTLSWSPDFIDVSESGDLGYTYGKYIYTYRDSLGLPAENTGYFHTVWKRQEDGVWRFVWD